MATPQSLIQSNIQNQVGTQTVAQNNQTMLPNNGNPFTIYNQVPPQGGYLPPTMDAYGNWMINPIPQVNPFWLQTPAGPGLPNYGSPGTPGPGGGGVPIPTAPPPSLPPTQPPSMGGPLPPSVVTPGGALATGGQGDIPRIGGGISINGTPLNHLTSGQLGGNPFGSSGGTGYGGGGFNFGSMFGGGGLEWQQLADALIPGNAWQNGQWNIGNILGGLVDTVTGLPISRAAEWAGGQGWGPEFLQNWAEQNATADVRAGYDAINPKISAAISGYQPSLNWNTNAQQTNNAFMNVANVNGFGWAVGQTNPITGHLNTASNPFGGAFDNPLGNPADFGNFNPTLSNPFNSPTMMRGMSTGSRMIGAAYDPMDPLNIEAREAMQDGIRNGWRGTRQAGGNIRGHTYAF